MVHTIPEARALAVQLTEKVDLFKKSPSISELDAANFTKLGLELRKKFIQVARAITVAGREKGVNYFKWNGHHARANWGADKKNGTDSFEDCTCIFITLIGAKLIHPLSQKAMHPTLNGQETSRINCVVEDGEIRVWLNMTNSFWSEVAGLSY